MNVLRLIPRNKPRTGLSQVDVLGRVDEDVRGMIGRGRFMGETLEPGPNWVHAIIGRGDTGTYGKPGTFEDLGWNHNLKTTVGMTWLRGLMGGVRPVGTTGVNTSATATSWTNTGAPFTASQLTGMIIVSPITGITTQPVWGNILSNTTSVIQVDQWSTQADAAGTTPATGNAALILPGQGPARYMALTTDTSGPATSDTALTSEYTTLALNRALSTYADTGATTFTQYKIWTASGGSGAIHKAGLFTGGYGASGGGVLVAATNLNADATLALNDTLAVTWTWTIPAAG
jgi:hypothetical protein